MTLKELERRIRMLQPDPEPTATITYVDGRVEMLDWHEAMMACLRHPDIVESCDDPFCDILLYIGERDPETGKIIVKKSPTPAELWKDYRTERELIS